MKSLLILKPVNTHSRFSVPLDHPDDMDPNDILTLKFGVIVTDKDGDQVQTTITINVADDGPSIETPEAQTIDESDNGSGDNSVTGTFKS